MHLTDRNKVIKALCDRSKDGSQKLSASQMAEAVRCVGEQVFAELLADRKNSPTMNLINASMQTYRKRTKATRLKVKVEGENV